MEVLSPTTGLPLLPSKNTIMSRALIIGAAQKDKIKNLVDYAEKNIFSMDDLLDTVNKEMESAGDMDGFSIDLPVGFKVVYSIEQQPAGKVRHLSVSVDTPGRCPSPESIQVIMDEIGFKNTLLKCKVGMEKIGENHEAVNVLELI